MFIRAYLSGEGPEYGAPAIDPDKGGCQEDIFYHYKLALIKAAAEDAAVRSEEKAAKREKRAISPDKIEELTRYYSERIPYKLHRARYHSFVNYFGVLKRLGWVEKTGKEEKSIPQDKAPSFQPKRYYRLTDKGKSVAEAEFSDPITALYHYPPEIRSAKKYHYYTKR
jgi:hypothetical protein